MEHKLFGILTESVIGFTHVEILVDDQSVTQYQQRLVVKGSLVTQLSHGEARLIANKLNPPHNYKCIAGRETITLYCKATQVYQLTESEKDLLNGVVNKSDRIEVLHNLDWVGELKFRSCVYVTIPTIPVPVRGLVYHIGSLEGELGTKFGIELQERRGEGNSDGTFQNVDYFECEPNCAVFVSMDKLTQKSTAEAAKGISVENQSPKPENDRPIKLGYEVMVFDKYGTPIKGTVRSVKKNVLGIETQKRIAHADIPGQVEDIKKRNDFTVVRSHHTKIFLPAELVQRNFSNEGDSKEPVAQSKPLQRQKNSRKEETTVDSQMDIDTEALKEFRKAGLNPGRVTVVCQQMALKQFEEEHKQKIVKPKKKHKEMVEQQKRIQEAKDELKMEDWSGIDVSLLDIEKQKKILEEATHAKKIQKEKMLHDAIVHQLSLQEKEKRPAALHKQLQEDNVQQQEKEVLARQKRFQEENREVVQKQQQQHQQQEAAQQYREEAAIQKRLQEESRLQEKAVRHQQEAAARQYREEAVKQKRQQEEAAQQERLENPHKDKIYENNEPNKNKYDDDDSQSEEFYDVSESLPEQQQKALLADNVMHIPNNHDITSSDSYKHDHFGNQPHEKVIKDQTHSQKDHKPIRSPDPQPPIENPHNLEEGSLIQFGNPPCYGVIKWIGSFPEANCTMAGVEVDAPIDGCTKYDDGWYGGKKLFESQINRGLFLPLKGLHPDGRFMVDEAKEVPNPIKEEEYNPTNTYVRPPSEFNKRYFGKPKGIQGHQNSCYLDATLYGMFAFSDAFDGIFLETTKFSSTENNKAREIQEIIREEIVYRLRLNGVVTYNHIMELREKLDKMMIMTEGLVKDEKDPEEFLNLLFKHVLFVDSFIKIRRPSGIDSEFFVQLFVEADKGMVLPTTQDLLHKMFKQQNITFAEYPSRLLIQVPRYGKKYKSFNGIIPSLELDITEICDGATSASHPCYVCGKAGRWICSQCNGSSFCNECKHLWHKHPGRENHHLVINQESADIEIGKLQLLSVLCIETSHYVCFTRIIGPEKSEWVFFDSMAERPDDKHNLPCVKRCTNDITRNVYHNKNIASESLKHLCRRFVEDTYLCIYFDPDGVMYQ